MSSSAKHQFTSYISKTFLIEREGGQTFFGIGGGDDDVDGGEEEDVSKANKFVSEASKLSAGAKIFRGP